MNMLKPWYPTVLLISLGLLLGAFGPRTKTEDRTLDRYREGRAALQRAIEAIGGHPSLSGFNDVSFSFQAVVRARGQSAAQDAEYTALPAAGKIIYDKTGRIRYDYRTALRGGREFGIHRAFDSNGGWTHRLAEDELTEMSTFDLGFLRRNPQSYPIDVLPHSLILSALGNPGSIRIGSKSEGSEATLTVEYSSQFGGAKSLVIDADTGLPVRMEYLTSDPLLGDTQAAVQFSEYRTVGGIRIPHMLRFFVGGEDVGHWSLSEVTVNTMPSDEVFLRPDKQLVEAQASFQPQRLADGVYAIRLYSGLGFTYNTMIVEFDDYLVVVEAPLSDLFYNVVKGIGGKIAPGKPIRYVVSTHYHFDHTGGLKSYIANGSTVLTVDDNARFIERMATVKHTLLPNPLQGSEQEVSIERIDGERILGNGGRRMRLIDVGPNPHVDEILVAYLPDEKILFVSDLLSTFDSGTYGSPTEALIAFNERLTQLGIDVETFVPGHGPTIGRSEFRRVLSVQ